MLLYRAMCETEAIQTKDRPAFLKRFKWFTPDISFINRVMDGKFNNSRYKPEKYTILMQFEIRNIDVQWFDKASQKELMLDRRKSHNIHWSNIKQLN